MAVRMADTAEPMGNFPIAKAKHIEFEDGEKLQEKLDNGTLGSGGGTPYDDTEVRALIDTNKTNIADLNTKIGTTAMGTTATDVTGAVAEVNGNLLDNVSFSADYKNIVLNRKNGTNPYTIPISAIINHAKLIELADVDVTDIGNGKTLVYDSATQKHKYADITATDELVKMDSTSDAHYLADLIDKQTVVNDNGVLKVKKLDGQEVTITEINYLKGLTMNVMDLVNIFSNGGVKIINTPVNTYAELLTFDKTSLIDNISYLIYVLADETHDNAKTTYLIDKATPTPTYFGFAGEHRDFTTNPIDLANEVTGKLGTANIDVDSLWSLLTIDDTYKTLTTTNNAFGTHGAKAMYDELVAGIGTKANQTDFYTHKDDTTIHTTQAEKDSYALKTEVLSQDGILTTTGSETSDTVYCSKLTKDELDKKVNKTVDDVPITYINKFEDETYVKPSTTNACSYHVTNGHCIIKLETVCLSTCLGFVQIFSGLPKPKVELFSNVIDRNMEANSGARGIFHIIPSGALRIVCSYGDSSVTGTRNFYATFSYPVAES